MDFILGGWGISGMRTLHEPQKRAPGWLGYIGDEILPTYMGIIS